MKEIYMNFIDKALMNIDQLTADDFLQAMADIYAEPEVRHYLSQYPQYVQDVIYIIDYDTELQMEGFRGFFSDRTKEQYMETYTALHHCGAVSEARILEAANAVDADADDWEEAYRALEAETALENDYEGFWNLVRAYIERMK